MTKSVVKLGNGSNGFFLKAQRNDVEGNETRAACFCTQNKKCGSMCTVGVFG